MIFFQMHRLNRVKYCFSHMPLYVRRFTTRGCFVYIRNIDYQLCAIRIRNFMMDQMKSPNKIGIKLVSYLSTLVLLIALCLGLYARWIHSQDIAIVLMAFLGLFIFAISCALVYYFSMEAIGFSLSRLWVGCLLGVISFTEDSRYQQDSMATILEIMDILLMSSLAIRCLSSIIERIANMVPRDTLLLNPFDHLEMVGMAVASLVSGRDFMSISLLVTAFGLTLLTIRLKSYIGVLNLLCLVSIGGALFFPKLLQVPVNPYALSCFIGRLSFEPLLDLYFSSLTTFERWDPLIKKPGYLRRCVILAIFVVELSFMVVSAKQMPNHKEWYIVVPIFVAFLLVWMTYHVVFLITCWQLSNKLSECNKLFWSLSEESRNMHRIMASRGARHFALIAQRLICVTFFTTLIIAAIGFETKSALSISLWLVCVPIEIAVINLVCEMGSTLGGTCIGYALVAPATYHRPDQMTTVLPTNALEQLGSRATEILNMVQKFFSFHLIDTYGCDYSSSGLTMESVQSKLMSFFQRQTMDGPRFDTYLVYYSGPVYENGDWALSDDGVLKFETLVEWWREQNEDSGARLFFILDTEHSYRWIKEVRRQPDEFLAVQTCQLNRTANVDEEMQTGIKFGDFTHDWVDYNCTNLTGVEWTSKTRALKAVYGVSGSWTDFTFRMPTEDDIAKHWDASFPKFTRPLIKVTNVGNFGSVCCCCDCVLKCLKRTRMSWLPPVECDTGHGFKLIRS